jgi:hypothetical protein
LTELAGTTRQDPSMTKLTTALLAIALSLSLASCSKDGSTSSSETTSSSSAVGTSDTPTADGTTTATPVVVDQTTPEAAMTSWLSAMVAGEGDTVCSLMATSGKPIPSIPGAAEACGQTITPMLDQLKELGSAFDGLTIEGATISGDKATFESVTTEPPMAADVVSSFQAVRIKDKWYVTQG